MASMIKTRGRKPVALGKMLLSWTRFGTVETYNVSINDEAQDRLFSLKMNREEAERLHAWLGKHLEEGNENNV